MKNLKRISLVLLTVFLSVTSTFSQNVVYYDTHTNSTLLRIVANQYPVDSITKDTLYLSDTTANVYSPFPTITHNVPSTYSKYIVEMELEHKQGGYNWNVDTNNTIILSGGVTITGSILDTITISGGSSVNYNIGNISNSGRYEVTSTIMHTVDTVFINSMSTSLFDNFDAPKAEFTLYPNPTIYEINIILESASNQNITFNIFDMSGRMIKQGNLFNNRIDVSDLLGGVYHIQLISENTVSVESFIKSYE